MVRAMDRLDSFNGAFNTNMGRAMDWSIFDKSGTEVTTPKTQNEFAGGQCCTRTTPSPIFAPQKAAILDQKVLKSMQT